MTVASDFWRNKTKIEYDRLYDIFNWKQRLSYDIQKILPHIRESKKICDLCCGDGTKIKILDSIMGFDEVFVTDINQHLIFDTLITTPDHFYGEVADIRISIPSPLFQCDTVIWLGGMNYIYGENIENLIKEIKPIKLVATVSCFERPKYICEMSNEIGEKFESSYPTVEWVMDLLKSQYDIVTHERMYPNSLEGKYGNKTFMFIGKMI